MREAIYGDAVKLVVGAASSDDAAAPRPWRTLRKGHRESCWLGRCGQIIKGVRQTFSAAARILPSTAAPGQISPNEALATTGLGRRVPKKYAVLLESDFGSRSPAMHNAAFGRAGCLIL